MRRVLDGIAWLWGRLLCFIKFHDIVGQLKFVDSIAVGNFMTVTKCARCEHILMATDTGLRFMRNPKDGEWYLWNAENNFEHPMPGDLTRIASGQASGLITTD